MFGKVIPNVTFYTKYNLDHPKKEFKFEIVKTFAK